MKPFIFLFILMSFSFAQAKNIALITFVKGDVKVFVGESSYKAEKGKWIKEGEIIETAAKSIAKLSFVDKSTMNIAPNSKLKVEAFSKEDTGVIEVISGKIRSQVTKDPLNQDKSKMIVKSKSAVMGIRGTDFLFSTNPKTGNTSAVLFQGSVSFNRLDEKSNSRSIKDLDAIVNKGVSLKPGQFSVAGANMKSATNPAKLDRRQLRALVQNKDFSSQSSEVSSSQKMKVPKGLNGALIASESESLKSEIQDKLKIDISTEGTSISVNSSDKTLLTPPDGSPLHLDTGVILPLAADAIYDENTKEWVSQDFGVDSSGNIINPEGYDITDEGKLVKADANGQLKEVVYEIKSPTEQSSLDSFTEQDINIQGPTPAGSESSNSIDDQSTDSSAPSTDNTSGLAPNGQDWFVPNSQVNTPRFIGPDGNTLPNSRVRVRVNQN